MTGDPSSERTGSLPTGAPAGYLELLRDNADFRRLYLARLVSLLGDWFNTLALLALLREIGGTSAGSFAWILIFKTLPTLFVAPLAGSLVDRFSRKGLLIAMDLLRAAFVAVLMTQALWPSVPLLYTLVVLLSVASAVSEPARNAVLPDLVRPKDLITANALGAVTWSAMFTLGVALGGLVTAGFGWQVALGIDLLTYLLSAAMIARLVVPPYERQPGRSGSFVAGLQFMRARPRVWSLALAKAGWSLAGGITLVLTILGERVYRLDDDSKGILAVSVLYVARGLGTGLGPIVARRLCGSDPNRGERAIGWGYLWGAGLYLVLGQVDGLALAAVVVLLAHLGGSTVWVFSTVRLQTLVPTEVRGRVFATEQGSWTLAMAASTYAFGAALDAPGADPAAITSAVGLVLLVPGALWVLRRRVLGDPAPIGEARG